MEQKKTLKIILIFLSIILVLAGIAFWLHSKNMLPGFQVMKEASQEEKQEAGKQKEKTSEEDETKAVLDNFFVKEGNEQIFTYGPVFTDLKLLNEEKKELMLSDIKQEGKHLLTFFWAQWCPHCTKEIPHLQKIYNKYKDHKELTFALVDLNSAKHKDKPFEGYTFLKTNGYDLPNYIDKTSESLKKYGMQYIPTSVFYDKNSKPVIIDKTKENKPIYTLHGLGLTEELLENYIEAMLQGKTDLTDITRAHLAKLEEEAKKKQEKKKINNKEN